LSGTYRTNAGDTWNLVARQTTGNDVDASKIQRANPGIIEPIPAGTVLQIPVESTADVTAGAGELELTAGGKSIGTFDGFSLSRSIDAIAKCGFTVPNEPETREIFIPLMSPDVTVDAGGNRKFTGRAESPQPNNATDNKTLGLGCYSIPGILEISNPPLSSYPLEWTEMNLVQIASELCSLHGVSVDFQADTGARFKRVDIKPGSPVLGFLADLASQRGPVISSDEFGRLVFWTGKAPGAPVSRLTKGLHPCESVSVSIDESRYYSSVTGTIPAKSKKGKGGKQFTVKNPHATGLVRPFVYEVPDIDEGELETAVETMAGRMFAAIFSAQVDVAAWEDGAGNIYDPNTTIELKSEEDLIPDFYEFLIADVTLNQSAGTRTASLNLVIPGAYSGVIPEAMPWQ
jgi:prophage tail gpP-like protein